MQRLITPAEAADLLSVKEHTIRQWLRNKQLRGVKLGGIWRIRESALEQFVNQNETGTEIKPTKLQKGYFTPAEVAELMNIEQARIRVWLRNGKLKGSMVGGRWQISSEAIDELRNR